MSVVSRLSVAAGLFNLELKKFFFGLLAVDTIAAAGSSQTTGTLLTAGRNVVTAADGTKGVVLPPAHRDMSVQVINTVSNQTLKVYAAVGEQINAISTASAFSQVGGAVCTYLCDANAHWYVAAANLTGTSTSASTAELDVLAGATSANATTGKAAILGTDGALTLGGALTAVTSIGIGNAVLSEAEMEMLDGITAGTSLPSKALVTDAAESLVWATTDATASETVTLSIQDTRTGAGATGWAEKVELVSNVALGSYANALYGLVTLGASGKITGLGAGVCGEMVLSAGTTDGTYACFEAELGMPSGASTGTATSFVCLSVYGADASTFDTNGFIFDIAGVTAGASKAFANNGQIDANELTLGLKCRIAGATYYIPLATAANFTD